MIMSGTEFFVNGAFRHVIYHVMHYPLGLMKASIESSPTDDHLFIDLLFLKDICPSNVLRSVEKFCFFSSEALLGENWITVPM